MATKRKRVTRAPVVNLTELEALRLRDEPLPSRGPESLFLHHGRTLDGRPSLGELWVAHGADVLAEWIEKHPGTRPDCWWRFSAPEPRRRIGGVGDRLSEVLAHVPHLLKGIPSEGWWTENEVETYRRLGSNPRHRSGREAIPVDESDPPRYESEVDYLDRLGLLSDNGERQALGR